MQIFDIVNVKPQNWNMENTHLQTGTGGTDTMQVIRMPPKISETNSKLKI